MSGARRRRRISTGRGIDSPRAPLAAPSPRTRGEGGVRGGAAAGAVQAWTEPSKTPSELRIAERPPHPRSLRSLDLSPHAGRGEVSDLVLAMRFSHPSFPHERQDCFCLQIKAKGGGAPKSAVHWSRIFGCGARLAIGALAFRRSTAALTEVSRPRHFGFRPGFLGRGSRRRYPPCACPSPAEAPRAPAVIPADMMPEAARERFARPPAGTAPAPHLRSHPECALRRAGCLLSYCIRHRVSRTNEFAFGAFVSN